MWTDYAAAVKIIWIDIIVVLFPLSFYLKKKAPKKSRHKGDCAAIRFAPIRRSFPLMYPPITAQPIAPLQDIVRNARQALRLAFLIVRMHVYRLSFSESKNLHTHILSR